MAITRVGTATADATSVALPAHIAGDVIVIAAWRDLGDSTIPSLPSGFTTMGTFSNNLLPLRLGFKIAASSGEVSGTWTNATKVQAWVGRGQRSGTPHGVNQGSSGGAATTTVTYQDVTGNVLEVADGTSWVVAFAYHTLGTNVGTQNPAGLTNQVTSPDGHAAVKDSNGGIADWVTTSVTVNASGTRRVALFEVVSAATPTVTQGGIYVLTGLKNIAGAYAATTGLMDLAALQAGITIALKPQLPLPPPPGGRRGFVNDAATESEITSIV